MICHECNIPSSKYIHIKKYQKMEPSKDCTVDEATGKIPEARSGHDIDVDEGR